MIPPGAPWSDPVPLGLQVCLPSADRSTLARRIARDRCKEISKAAGAFAGSTPVKFSIRKRTR